MILFYVIRLAFLAAVRTVSLGDGEEKPKESKVHRMAYVRKTKNKTTIDLDTEYEPGVLVERPLHEDFGR